MESKDPELERLKILFRCGILEPPEKKDCSLIVIFILICLIVGLLILNYV